MAYGPRRVSVLACCPGLTCSAPFGQKSVPWRDRDGIFPKGVNRNYEFAIFATLFSQFQGTIRSFSASPKSSACTRLLVPQACGPCGPCGLPKANHAALLACFESRLTQGRNVSAWDMTRRSCQPLPRGRSVVGSLSSALVAKFSNPAKRRTPVAQRKRSSQIECLTAQQYAAWHRRQHE